MKRLLAYVVTAVAVALAAVAGVATFAADRGEPPAMFGGTPSRNMVSSETGLPTTWDVASGKNIKWHQKLGSQTYAGPVIHGGQVYVGTNNEGGRRPGIEGDKGVVMAFRASDGEFLWQATHDKLPAGRVNDWPLQGICSTPYVDDDRVYYVSNRGEVVAADPDGFRDGKNDGVQDEALKTEIDADILWRYDMIKRARRLPAQPRGRIAAGDRRHRLRRDRQRRRRGPHQHPVAARAELRRGQQEHRRAGVGERDCRPRRSSTAPGPTRRTAPPVAASRSSSRAATAGSTRSSPRPAS